MCKLKKWAEIGRDLGYSGKIMSSLSTSLKNSYQRWLFPYEEYLRLAKPGVHAQLEFEYGAPLTPSPANSPMKKSHQNTPSSLRAESPAMRAHDALNATIGRQPQDVKDIPMLDTPNHVAPAQPIPPPSSFQPQNPPVVSSGFTPVNAGGFTPVNHAPATFTPIINHAQRREREREPESSFTPPRRTVESPLSSAKNTPEYRPSALSAAPLSVTNGFTSNPLKRQLSHDSADSRKENSMKEDSENGGRRSKRLKKGTFSINISTDSRLLHQLPCVSLFKDNITICCSMITIGYGSRLTLTNPADGVPTVAGSHMTLFRPSTPRIPGDSTSIPGEVCWIADGRRGRNNS